VLVSLKKKRLWHNEKKMLCFLKRKNRKNKTEKKVRQVSTGCCTGSFKITGEKKQAKTKIV